MATQEYVYRIEIENKSPSKERKSASAKGKAADTKNKPQIGGGVDKYVKGAALYGYAKNAVSRVIQSGIAKTNIRTGYEELQARQQFTYSIAMTGIGIIESAVVGGLTGGLPGAVVGAAVSVTSELVNVGIRRSEINAAKSQESISIMLNQIRMGSGGRREGRTE